MSKEKNCKWRFDPQPVGGEKGPNDPNALKFQGSEYHSFIRESIQNSLDAVNDKSKPVVVSFDYREFEGFDYPNFFDLREHIKGCLEKYPGDQNANRIYEPMLDFFKEFRTDQKIGYLRVRDSNTTGMPYDKNDAKSPFNAFISEGIASKPNGSGGAFGFGKAVFWMDSPFNHINTVFVSTKVSDTQSYFVGQAKLCTHIVNGQNIAPNGLYSTDGNGQVICNENDIPEEFRTKEIGTTIFCLGCEHISEEYHNKLVEAVLRNFWLAIYNKKLVVNIENETISKETLPKLMDKFFDDNLNTTKKIEEYNPKPYFEIVKQVEENGDSEKYKKISEAIDVGDDNYWNVTLYLRKDEKAKGLYEFMRSPLMTVYIDSHSEWKRTDGVFVCSDEKGNMALREMEDSAHDSWNQKNFKARGNKGYFARTALSRINDFISEQIKAELHSEGQDTVDVFGLEDLLYATADGSDKEHIGSGRVDPNSVIDIKKSKPKNKPKSKPVVQKKTKMRATFDPKGRLRSNRGRKKRVQLLHRIIKPGSLSGKFSEDPKGKEGIYAVPVDVDYRAWSSKDESGRVWHTIRLYSPTEIDNAIVQVFGIDNEGKQIGLNIEETKGYDVREGEVFEDNTDFDDNKDNSTATKKQVKNAVDGVNIKPNIPTDIILRFNSKIQYSLRIFSDKIEKNETK